MNVGLMRAVDAWAGIPLCALLTVVRRAGDFCLRRRVSAGFPGKIVLVKFSEQGSLVLSAGLVNALSARFPGVELFIVTFGQNQPLVSLLGYVPASRILSVRSGHPLAFVVDFLRVVMRLRRERIDAVIDLEFFSRCSAVLSFLSAAPLRAGFSAAEGKGPYRGDLLTHAVPFERHTHVVEAYARFARVFDDGQGEMPPDVFPRFFPDPGEVELMRGRLRSDGFPEAGRLVLVHVGDGNIPLREWSAHRCGELIDRFLGVKDCWVAVVGLNQARDKGEEMRKACRCRERVLNYAGATSLRELLCLALCGDVLIASDSGLAHLVSLTPLPKIVLFGPETPAVFAPRGHGETIALFKGLACSPCFSALNNRQSRCRDNRCVSTITAEEVFVHAQRFLSAGGRHAV